MVQVQQSQSKITTNSQDIVQIKEQNSLQQASLDNIIIRLVNLDSRINNISQQLKESGAHNNITNADATNLYNPDNIENLMFEINERNKRYLNLMFFGVR